MQPLLSNVKVLDLSRILAGPWASQILADLGADVIKVERPGLGDDTRSWGPPFLKDEQGQDTSDGAYFIATNRGKRSITLDLQTPEGQALVKDLCRDADVVLENYKVGTLARLGLDYDSLSKINPRIITASVKGFGSEGPYASYKSFEMIAQAMGGVMSLTGSPDGPPMRIESGIGDTATGLHAAIGILGAIIQRGVTGVGQRVEVAQQDVVVNLTRIHFRDHWLGVSNAPRTPGQPPSRDRRSFSPRLPSHKRWSERNAHDAGPSPTIQRGLVPAIRGHRNKAHGDHRPSRHERVPQRACHGQDRWRPGSSGSRGDRILRSDGVRPF